MVCAVAVTGFSKAKKSKDDTPKRFAIEINSTLGGVKRDMGSNNNTGNFLQPAVYNPGKLKFTGGSSVGFDGQFFAFVGQKRNLGMGIGVWYASQKGDMSLDSFHVEYKATNHYGTIFRQLLTANSLIESQHIKEVNIPIVARYKIAIKEKLAITIDGGLVLNIHETTQYDTKAYFDFEAIYKYTPAGQAVYDDAVVPDATDIQITRKYLQNAGLGATTQQYFANARATGSQVGLDIQPNNNSQHGQVSYAAGSIGFLLRPSIAYNFTPEWSVVLGGYLMSMSMNNKPRSDYRIIDLDGNYSSPVNAVTTLKIMSYGANLGLRYSF